MLDHRVRSLLWSISLILLISLISQGMSKAEEVRQMANIQIWSIPSSSVRAEREMLSATEGARTEGELTLENEHFSAVFRSGSGEVVIYSKSGEKRVELAPLQSGERTASIISHKVLQNTDDAANVEVYFSAEGKDSSVVFSFSKDQIIQIKSVEGMDGVSILSPMEFAVVPSFISDDLILAPGDYPPEALHIPAEKLLLGLQSGENSMLVVTWPDGNQRVRLTAKDESLFESIDFENDGKSLYLAILEAPGIWHREVLKRSYLEKDIAVDWKRPFPAKWITQLYEDGVKTTYTFRNSKKESFWRAGMGRYTYPVWFDGETAFYRLGKKIPPKEESLIYCLERQETPVSVSTPVDILRRTLDEETYERIVDSEGRQNRDSNPPGCGYDAATCAITDKIKVIFAAGEETQKQESIEVGTEDMSYFMLIEQGRAVEYEIFAKEMMESLSQMKKSKPELKAFLNEMEEITREIIAAYEHEKENIGNAGYTKGLAEETQALARQSSPDNLEAFMRLKGRWTSMGGAVEDVNRALHTTTRKLFQRAGYSSVTQSEAVEVAQDLRKRITKCLRKPSPYEIWANY